MSSVLCWWYFTYIMSEHEHNDDKRKFVVDTLSEKVKAVRSLIQIQTVNVCKSTICNQ